MDIERLQRKAAKIIESVEPAVHPATNCLFHAALAQAALRGWGWRFSAGGAFLPSSQVSGWGMAIDPAGRRYIVTADRRVDESGEYCGHCWLELPGVPGFVCDLMEGYTGPRQREAEPTIVYHHIPSLARSIRAFHGERLAAVARAARADRQFCAGVRRWVDRTMLATRF